MAKDLNDVMLQMAAQGIHVPQSLDLGRALSKFLRFRPEGQKSPKKSGWVRLHEYVSPGGKRYISGAFGIWSGARNDSYPVEATATDWSPAERAAWLEQRKAAERAAAQEREHEAETAAAKARRMWVRGRELHGAAQHPYLVRKQVHAFGVRQGFNERLLVPLRDLKGDLHGLQYIAPDGTKIFGTGTIKAGRSHLLGAVDPAGPVLAFAEGYATAASVHMAVGWPVVCCFDAGNMQPVMQAYRALYPELEFVIAADDDRHMLRRLAERLAQLGIAETALSLTKTMAGGVLDETWQIPGQPAVTVVVGWKNDLAGVARLEGTLQVGDAEPQPLVLANAGQAAAMVAARKLKAKVLTPRFTDGQADGTDWNDLQVAQGLDAVREQLLRQLEQPLPKPRANVRAQRGGSKGEAPSRPLRDGELPMLERYVLIYGTSTVWDAQQREIIRYEALKLARGGLADWWLRHEDRREVPQANVVFDPTGKSQLPDYVNLFDKLPVKLPPEPGASCARIVEHLYNLCKGEDRLFDWVVRWLAYPLQHPGAKMRTAILMHGRTEGTGKSKLAEIMRAIYGRYATSVGQAELQRDFNDWVSAKLFIACEEVVSRQDRAHLQGALQALITQPTVQINTKNMPIREEANHANFIFFSNQQTPALINPRDRRYLVIRVEQEHPPEYFDAIDGELRAGGAAAFYEYLMKVEMGDFSPFTRPLATKDRLHLITLGMSPDQRFFEYWQAGLAGVPFVNAPAGDLYSAFKAWCKLNGERYVANSTTFGRTMSEELERIKAPEKRKVRYQAWSDKTVVDGDWKEDKLTQQGVVYFVPARLDRPPDAPDDAAEPPEPIDVTHPEERDRRIARFQAALHDLLLSARRAL